MYIGTLYILSAPSGAGKSSLIKAYLDQNADQQTDQKTTQPAKVSVSHTTRAPRPGEKHAKHYYFVSNQKFEQLIAQDAFVEYAKVFDHYYGTTIAEIESSLTSGIDVFLDIDWQGAQQVRAKVPAAKSIFILPPSLTELEQRLIKRGQDTPEVIAKRMQKAQAEMSHYAEYDYIIINDDFTSSLAQLIAITTATRLQTSMQQQRYTDLINTLLSN